MDTRNHTTVVTGLLQETASSPPPGGSAAAAEPAPAGRLVRAGAGEVATLHGAFVARITNEKPVRIVGGLADPADVEERHAHIEHVITALGDYIAALIDDLNINLPVTDTIDLGDWSGLLADITADHLSAPLTCTAHRLGEARYGDANPRRHFNRRRAFPNNL